MPNCLGGQCEHIYAYTGETLNLNSTNSQMLKELHNVKNGKVTVVSKEVDDIECEKAKNIPHENQQTNPKHPIKSVQNLMFLMIPC